LRCGDRVRQFGQVRHDEHTVLAAMHLTLVPRRWSPRCCTT
jgi:hypothetical protein